MEATAVISLFIVDDHQVVIDSLRLLLGDIQGFVIAGETTQPLLVTQMLENTQVDILITDVSMPGMNGIELTRAVKKKFGAIRVLALSMFSDSRVIAEMIDAGISGYVLKNSGRHEMTEALNKIAKGQLYFSAEASALLASSFKRNPQALNFTERETEVIVLIEKKMSNKEIATLLNLGERTVEIHRKNISNKTKTHGIAGTPGYPDSQK